MTKGGDKLPYNTFLVISSSNLGQVTVVVAFHFQIENFAFCLRSIRDQELFQQRLKQKQRTQCCEHACSYSLLKQQLSYATIYLTVKTSRFFACFLHVLHSIVSYGECVLNHNSRHQKGMLHGENRKRGCVRFSDESVRTTGRVSVGLDKNKSIQRVWAQPQHTQWKKVRIHR